MSRKSGAPQAKLIHESLSTAQLDEFLSQNVLSTGNGSVKSFLIDASDLEYEQFLTVVDTNNLADISRGYHSRCWDLSSNPQLFRLGSHDAAALPEAFEAGQQIVAKWVDIFPGSSTQIDQFRNLQRVACGPNADEILLEMRFSEVGSVALDAPLRWMENTIDLSRHTLVSAVRPDALLALKSTRDDWEHFMTTGAQSTSVPDYLGWRAVPRGSR